MNGWCKGFTSVSTGSRQGCEIAVDVESDPWIRQGYAASPTAFGWRKRPPPGVCLLADIDPRTEPTPEEAINERHPGIFDKGIWRSCCLALHSPDQRVARNRLLNGNHLNLRASNNGDIADTFAKESARQWGHV